ncbi:MAG TPA: hypothetical protein P5136_00175 [Methanofastidiosum sp.]|nr:hypothetical protein [Methanofastidiosum sp.]
MKKDRQKVSILIDKILTELDTLDDCKRALKDKYYSYIDVLKTLRTIESEYISKKDLENINNNIANELMEE